MSQRDCTTPPIIVRYDSSETLLSRASIALPTNFGSRWSHIPQKCKVAIVRVDIGQRHNPHNEPLFRTRIFDNQPASNEPMFTSDSLGPFVHSDIDMVPYRVNEPHSCIPENAVDRQNIFPWFVLDPAWERYGNEQIHMRDTWNTIAQSIGNVLTHDQAPSWTIQFRSQHTYDRMRDEPLPPFGYNLLENVNIQSIIFFWDISRIHQSMPECQFCFYALCVMNALFDSRIQYMSRKIHSKQVELDALKRQHGMIPELCRSRRYYANKIGK